MASGLFLAGLLLADASGAVITVEAGPDRVDVGYSELAAGQPQAAIARIKGNPRIDAEDPAAHINLGAAYARLGQLEQARNHYRAAMLSAARCDLELADGTWMDSRKAARVAERMLDRGETLALR